MTVGLTFCAVVLGTTAGVGIAFLRRSRNPLLHYFAKTYIEFFRAIPVLVLLIWIFYVVPILFGWRISAFFVAVLALSLHLAAFVAETVRAGLASIPFSQSEAGLALGMTDRQVMLRIVAPQAIRHMLPNLMGLYIAELKNSSLASIIAVNELLHRANITISETFRPLEIYTTVAVVYLMIILPLVYLSRLAERRFTKHDGNFWHDL